MSAIDKGYVAESRHEFAELLRARAPLRTASPTRWWVETTDEETVGDPGSYGGRPWLFVEAGSVRCHLNADTHRSGVRRFLDLVRKQGADLEWRVIANRKAKINRVAFGPDVEKVKKFCLYTEEEVSAPTVL